MNVVRFCGGVLSTQFCLAPIVQLASEKKDEKVHIEPDNRMAVLAAGRRVLDDRGLAVGQPR